MAVELLRKCLDVREALEDLGRMIGDYGYEDLQHNVEHMQALERTLFERLDELDKP